MTNLPKIGGELVVGIDANKGNERVPGDFPDETVKASELYFFDDPSIPATQTVENYLNQFESHINDFLTSLKKS